MTSTMTSNSTNDSSVVSGGDDSLSSPLLARWPAIDAIDLYVTPLWYVIGIPGNILAFVVWVQRRMRPSSGCYLAALALDECLFLIMQIFYELQVKWNINLLQLPGLCEFYPVMFLTAQHLSPLLVLAFTTDRYVSVCHPFEQERFCSRRRPLATILVLTTIALGINAVQAYFWTYNYEDGDCGLRPEVIAAGSSSLWSVWSWVTELLVCGLVPLVILLLNVLVIAETRRLLDQQKELTYSVRLVGAKSSAPQADADIRQQQKSSSPSATTFMLLAVSFYLIITTLPVTICYSLSLSFPEGDPDVVDYATDPTWRRYLVYSNVRTLVEEMGLSHYACNFYIYLMTGRVFRRELRRLLCGTDQANNEFTSAGRRLA